MTKQERRELMKQCTEWIDDAMKEFDGDIVRIVAKENGHEVRWRRRG